MKKIIGYILLVITLLGIVFYNDTISNFIMVNFIYKRDIVIENPNQYKKNTEFQYVKQTTDFSPSSKSELMNIIYTILNNGWDSFTFFCDTEYKNCTKDVSEIIENKELISNLNNFVSPYNSYNRLFVNYNNFGKVTIDVEKIYTEDQIKQVDQRIDEIINNIIKPNMKVEEKIKAYHDYIINETVYDSINAEKLKQNKEINTAENSHNAYGLLFNHKSLCGGYSDAMAIFLDKLNIPNMKVSNNSHVWNLVYLNNKWYHIDLTWDDPVVDTKENLLLYNYFLISNQELQNRDSYFHKFDPAIYIEAQ